METCSRCGKQEERATAKNPKKGMLWNDLSQSWKCQICDRLYDKVVIGADVK